MAFAAGSSPSDGKRVSASSSVGAPRAFPSLVRQAGPPALLRRTRKNRLSRCTRRGGPKRGVTRYVTRHVMSPSRACARPWSVSSASPRPGHCSEVSAARLSRLQHIRREFLTRRRASTADAPYPPCAHAPLARSMLSSSLSAPQCPLARRDNHRSRSGRIDFAVLATSKSTLG